MGWQGYDNEACMPGDRDRIARVSELTQRLKHKPDPVIAERTRLEREVIRCAKLFTTIKDGEINATWSHRVALSANDLDDAVRKLIDFESQIKK